MLSPKTVQQILIHLKKHYRGKAVWLGGANPYRVLIATILSAQTTDDQVDKVTPPLFRKYSTPGKLGRAQKQDVERMIKSVGLYRAKAKNINATGKMLATKFHGKVPQTREELMELPGVGRKTANVVLIKAFGKSVMPVDTHVFRIVNRIGLVKTKTPEETEAALEKIIPQRLLGAVHHWLIYHGRTLCKTRNPHCQECPISSHCDDVKQKKTHPEETTAPNSSIPRNKLAQALHIPLLFNASR